MLPRVLLLSVVVATIAVAAPREFPFTWTSRTADVGQSQLEAWLTPRIIRTDEYFRMDSRLVWTHGIARALETQLSMDLDFEHTNNTSSSFDPRFTSLWKASSWRAGAPFSFGGLGRATIGFDSFELEARLFAELDIKRVLLALNVSGSRAFFWNGRSDIDTRLEEDLALKYRLGDVISIGLEGRFKSAWQRDVHSGSALYVGPLMAWNHPKFFLTFGLYAQVAAVKPDVDKDTTEKQELRDNERFQMRLVFGFPTL